MNDEMSRALDDDDDDDDENDVDDDMHLSNHSIL